jgi:hypothetical protein
LAWSAAVEATWLPAWAAVEATLPAWSFATSVVDGVVDTLVAPLVGGVVGVSMEWVIVPPRRDVDWVCRRPGTTGAAAG